MDNPYQPPSAPLTAPTTDEPIDGSVIIDSAKGPVRLERRGEAITLVFGDVRKDIPSAKFAATVLMHFTRTKRISFKPFGLYSVAISEAKFREVLEFYGIERFKCHDIRTMRIIHGITGPLFLFLTALNTHIFTDWSIYALGLLSFGAMSLVLFVMTFFRLYLTFWIISALTNLILGATMVWLWFTGGDWWVLAVLIFMFFSLSTNLGRIRYFRNPVVENRVR
ncbi:MAG: hypothetical protein H0W78_10460 [Planctomycetes bacterium]|nr:hypothetical protein [Planctomycetota bacterium]